MLYSFALPLALVSSLVSGQVGYAPVTGACPSASLIRSSTGGVNPSEASFIAKRYAKASTSLAAWLKKVDPNFPVLAAGQYPMIALSDGGGGLRGFTISAGVHKAFDGEEPDAAKYSTAGLYQAITYEAGLSGSAIMLYSYVQNNWPLTSTLLSKLWIPAMAAGFSSPQGTTSDAVITADITMKTASGHVATLTDLWGRILSYGSFFGTNPGESATISNFTNMPGYTSFLRPYPIVTALGLEQLSEGCGLPPLTATQYEFTPHEFGSWESGIQSFIQSKYMGTVMDNGKPSSIGLTGNCLTGFDNAGWVAATSSSTFNQQCSGTEADLNGFFSTSATAGLRGAFPGLLGTSQQTNYALMPNPFQGLTTAPKVNNETQLTLIDGGESIQVPPLWPFLYREEIDTVIVSDNSADSPANYQKNKSNPHLINLPSGQQIYHTYQQSVVNNISYRMPYIPPPATFMANNFNKRALTFFGCSLSPTSSAMFIIYLPNRRVVFDSNVRATVTQYNESTTLGMIANGEAIATNNGDPQFAKCLACGIMKRSAAKAKKALPSECAACFTKYCSTTAK